jgi:hypothetical protein
MAWTVRDRWDNEITLTDERWQHIVAGHWELEKLLDDVLDTLRSGIRKQHPVDPNKYRYAKKFSGLPHGYMRTAKRSEWSFVLKVPPQHRGHLSRNHRQNIVVIRAVISDAICAANA